MEMYRSGTVAEAPPVADTARRTWRSGRKKQAPTDAQVFSGTARGRRPLLCIDYNQIWRCIEVVVTRTTRKVAELITLQPSKALVFSQYLANASFFLNFG